jgi:hypothetical protein
MNFTFRQRAGKLDWKLVTAISLDDLFKNMKIRHLQSILDPVTFCEFCVDDVKGNSVESITLLVKLMQLISEYLLHCQESQFTLINELNAKHKILKSNFEKLKKENIVLKEDTKIYQRQLTMLRQSLSKLQDLNFDYNGQQRVQPKIVVPYDEKNVKTKESNELITSLLQHERETRNFMTTIIDEQRKSFLQEISYLVESFQSQINDNKNNNNNIHNNSNNNQSNNENSNDALILKFRKEIENVFQNIFHINNDLNNNNINNKNTINKKIDSTMDKIKNNSNINNIFKSPSSSLNNSFSNDVFYHNNNNTNINKDKESKINNSTSPNKTSINKYSINNYDSKSHNVDKNENLNDNYATRSNDNNKNNNDNNNVNISTILKNAAFENFENELKQKETELIEKEKILKIKEKNLQDLEVEFKNVLQKNLTKNNTTIEHRSLENKQLIFSKNILNSKLKKVFLKAILLRIKNGFFFLFIFFY